MTPNFGDDKEKEHGCKEGYYFHPEEDCWFRNREEGGTSKGFGCENFFRNCQWRNWWYSSSDFCSSCY